MDKKSGLKNLRGFTLIEIMVATVLMAMMGFLLMASLNTSVRAKDNVEHVSQRFQEVRQAMSRMSRELSMAYLSKHFNSSDPAFVTQFKGSKDRVYFSAFGYNTHQKDSPESDQQVLAFYLATDKNGQQSLMRRVHPNLNLDVEKEGRAQVLCPNVSKLEFSYYDSKTEKWEESWLADPLNQSAATQVVQHQDSKKKNKEDAKASAPKPWRLPSFVRISMTADMGEGDEMTWVSETEIVVQEPLDLQEI